MGDLNEAEDPCVCVCVYTDEHLGGTRQGSQSDSRRQRAYSVGLGRRRSSRDSEDMEEPRTSTGIQSYCIRERPSFDLEGLKRVDSDTDH